MNKLLHLPYHRVYKTHEEITVPATRPAVPPPDEKLVNVSELPDWARPTFAGFERLNRIQSRIFPTAFHSNENILVCAPTGTMCSRDYLRF